MSKRNVLFVSILVVLVAMIGVSAVSAGSFERELKPAPHPPECVTFRGRVAILIVRCADKGGDISDIYLLSPSPDVLQTVTKIDGDTAELRVYMSAYGAEVSFTWFVWDKQGNVTTGRYP